MPFFKNFSNRPSGVVIKNKKKLGAKEGDLITLINFAIRYSYIKKAESRKGFCTELQINQKSMDAAEEIRRQLTKYMKKYNIEIKSCDDDTDAIIKCIVTGFFDKAAQRQPDGSYISVRGKEKLYLHPQSIMNAVSPSWIIYTEVSHT
jgi:HrpA-like RNA helicase